MITRAFVIFISCFFSGIIMADEMIGKPYPGEVQECYKAHQDISSNPSTSSLYSAIDSICKGKGGSKVAYKVETLQMTEGVRTITYLCMGSGTVIFGCRYYLSGFSF